MAGTRLRQFNAVVSFVLLLTFLSVTKADEVMNDQTECVILLHGLANPPRRFTS